MSYFYFNWNSDCQFGAGVNVVTGKTIGANAFQDPSSVDLNEYENSDSEAQQVFVEDTTSYASTVDAAVSASGSAWGGSASGSAEYISSASLHTYAMRLMGYDHIEKNKYLANLDGLETFMGGTPRKWLNASGDDFNPQAFFDKYGTYFISGYIKGGTIIADYTLKFSSQSEMDSLSADVKASYSELGFSAEMDASISKISESSSVSFSTDANCRIYGGTNAGEVVVNSCQGIKDAIESFDDDLGAGDELYAIVQPWTDIPWVAEQLEKWDGDLDKLFFKDDQDKTLAALFNEYSNLLVIDNTVQPIIDKREYTFQTRLDMLNSIVSDCNDGMTAITNYIGDPSNVPVNPNDIPADCLISADVYNAFLKYQNPTEYTLGFYYDFDAQWNPSSGPETMAIKISDVEGSSYTTIGVFTSSGDGGNIWYMRMRVGKNEIRANFKRKHSDDWNAFGAEIFPKQVAEGSLESDWSKVWPAESGGKEVKDSDKHYDTAQFWLRVV